MQLLIAAHVSTNAHARHGDNDRTSTHTRAHYEPKTCMPALPGVNNYFSISPPEFSGEIGFNAHTLRRLYLPNYKERRTAFVCIKLIIIIKVDSGI